MKDEQKTKKQLIDELTELRHRISKSQSLETEHEQTGQLLKEPENIFKSVFENAGVAIFIADAATGAILDCNIQAEKLIGRRRVDIIGMYQSKLHPKGEEEKYRNRFSRHAEKGHAADYQGEVQHMDGSRTPVFISAHTMKLNGKNMVVGIFTDISELKRAEQELTKTKEQGNYFASISIIRDITDRKKIEQKLLQAEKLKSLGELAGGHHYYNAAYFREDTWRRRKINTPFSRTKKGKNLGH